MNKRIPGRFTVCTAAGRHKSSSRICISSAGRLRFSCFQYLTDLLIRIFICQPVKMCFRIRTVCTRIHQLQPFLCRRPVFILDLLICLRIRIRGVGRLCPFWHPMTITICFVVGVFSFIPMADLSPLIGCPLGKYLKALPWDKAQIFLQQPAFRFLFYKAVRIFKPLIQIKLASAQRHSGLIIQLLELYIISS